MSKRTKDQADLTIELQEPDKAEELKELVAKIEAANGEYVSTFKKALPHAIQAGEHLLECYRIVGFGNWCRWLKENVKISERTCQRYMLVAEHKDWIEINSASLSELTLVAAEAQIALHKREVRKNRKMTAARKQSKLEWDPVEITTLDRTIVKEIDGDAEKQKWALYDWYKERDEAYLQLPTATQMLINQYWRLLEVDSDAIDSFLWFMLTQQGDFSDRLQKLKEAEVEAEAAE